MEARGAIFLKKKAELTQLALARVGSGDEEEAVEKVTSGRRRRGWEVVTAVNKRWMRRGVI